MDIGETRGPILQVMQQGSVFGFGWMTFTPLKVRSQQGFSLASVSYVFASLAPRAQEQQSHYEIRVHSGFAMPLQYYPWTTGLFP